MEILGVNAAISKMPYLNKSIEQLGNGFRLINSLCRAARIKYSYEFSDNGFINDTEASWG